MGLGILADGINEIIATTADPATGVPNAAPMGIICRNGRTMMRLFHGTDTEANIRASGWVVANLTFDPMVYVQSAFADLPEDAFTEISADRIDGIPMQRLSACEAWEAFTATVVSDNPETLVVELTPVASEIVDLQPHPPNRAFAGIIEATVHATRYVVTRDPALWALIEQAGAVVRKCGGEECVEAFEVLLKYCRHNNFVES